MFLSLNAHGGQKTLHSRAKTVVHFIPVVALFLRTVSPRVDDTGPCMWCAVFLSCIRCASLWAITSVSNDLFSPVENA